MAAHRTSKWGSLLNFIDSIENFWVHTESDELFMDKTSLKILKYLGIVSEFELFREMSNDSHTKLGHFTPINEQVLIEFKYT